MLSFFLFKSFLFSFIIYNMMKNEFRSKRRYTILTLILLIAVTAIASAILFKLQFDYLTRPEDVEIDKTYDRYYAFISESEDTVFWQEVYESVKKEGEAHNICVEDFASEMGSRYTAAERTRLAVWSDVDGIIAEGSSSALKSALIEADEAGIPVVLVGNDNTEVPRKSFVGVSRYDLGLLYARQIAGLSKKLLNDRDSVNVMILNGAEESGAAQDLLINTIYESLTNDADLTGRIYFNTREIQTAGSFAAQEAVMDLLLESEAEGEVPDILVAFSGDITNSSYQALIDLNLIGRCNIIGYYISDTIRDAIENENIYATIMTDADTMGKSAFSALEEYTESGYVSEYFAVDAYVLTKDSLAEETVGDEE